MNSPSDEAKAAVTKALQTLTNAFIKNCFLCKKTIKDELVRSVNNISGKPSGKPETVLIRLLVVCRECDEQRPGEVTKLRQTVLKLENDGA